MHLDIPTGQDQAFANNYKGAFMQAVEEFNSYGTAVYSAKTRIDPNAALQLYGFKASGCSSNYYYYCDYRFFLRIPSTLLNAR